MKNFILKIIIVFNIVFNILFINNFCYANVTLSSSGSLGISSQRSGSSSSPSYSYYINPASIREILTEDGPQYVLSTISYIKMTQDNDNYYFNYILKYESPITKFRKTDKLTTNEYKKIINGQVYLTNIPIYNISYNYSNDFSNTRGSLGYTYYWSNYPSEKFQTPVTSLGVGGTEILSLSFNDNLYHSSQSASVTQTYSTTVVTNSYNHNYSTIDWSYPRNYTSNDSNVPDTNWTGLINSTFSYPWNTSYFAFFSNTSHAGASLFDMPPLNPLFKDNQIDFTNPVNNTNIKNINSSISSEELTEEDNLLYWNNTFSGKFIVPKNLIYDYRYINMYAPIAVYTNKNSVNVPNITTSTSENAASSRLNKYKYITQNVVSNEAISVHSNEAIDLLNYTAFVLNKKYFPIYLKIIANL